MPGMLAGAGLVLLSTLKELPATLLLAPLGFQTLATKILGGGGRRVLCRGWGDLSCAHHSFWCPDMDVHPSPPASPQKSRSPAATIGLMDTTYSVRYREYAEANLEIEGGRDPRDPGPDRRLAWCVAGPLFSEMVHRMADEGLVTIEDEIKLSDSGRHLAAVIVRRHRLAERFLSEVLKLPWAKVHAEAEVWRRRFRTMLKRRCGR